MIAPVEGSAAPLLAALHARAFDKPWSAEEFAQLMQNRAVFALLASDGDTPQGFAMAWTAVGDAELLTVAVVPDARRRGIGAALIAAAAAAAASRGAATMHLEVAEDNAPARALYAKLGYAEAGRRRAYYSSEAGHVDALVMRRALQAPAG